MEEKIDAIISLLNEGGTLEWRQISLMDAVAYSSRKYNVKITEAEVRFTLDLLEKEGLVVVNKDTSPDQYALSLKGIQWKQRGGFNQYEISRKSKDKLISKAMIGIYVATAYFAIEVLRYFLGGLFGILMK